MPGMIYLDHAATTQIAPEVLEAMQPFLFGKYGNASTLYDLGKISKEAVEHARRQAADVIGAKPEEIYFTSGGKRGRQLGVKNSCQDVPEKRKPYHYDKDRASCGFKQL